MSRCFFPLPLRLGSCWLLAALLSSCLNLSSRNLDGPYFVAQDPAAAGMTLYYADSPSHDGGFDRIRDVQRAGFTKDFIFAQSGGKYFYIKRAADRLSDLNDPAVLQAISPAMTEAGFRDFLRKQGLQGFIFQYSAND